MAGTKLPDAVAWHEGMRLTPRHFQHQDQRNERLPAYLLSAVQPFHWGVLNIKFEMHGAVLKVLVLEAIMPDGRCIRYDDRDRALSLDLSELKAKNHPATVSLALKMLSIDDVQTDGTRQMGLAPEYDCAPDSDGLRTWHPALELVCGHPQAYDSTKLLPLLRYQNGAIEVTYIPPMPRIEPGSPLYVEVDTMAARLQKRLDAYADQFRVLNNANEQQKADQLQWKMAMLGSQLRELEGLYLQVSPHPQPLYLTLCRLFGNLAALAPHVKVERVPAFDYSELRLCIGTLLALLDTLLDALGNGITRSIFKSNADHVFRLKTKLCLGNRYHLGLLAPPDLSEWEIGQWLDNACVTTDLELDGLEKDRSHGFDRNAVEPKDSTPFEAGPGMRLFELILPAGETKYFQSDITLVIRGPLLQSPASIVLFETPAVRSTARE